MREASPELPTWPTVPACYGWLSLDARGRWRLKGERVEHGGLCAFLNANYASDEEGNWLVHNGPQRVFVALETAPLVLRLLPDDVLLTHDGRHAQPAPPVLIDENGCVSLQTDLGPAAIDDRDLALLLAELTHEDGRSVDDAALLKLVQGQSAVPLHWRGLPLRFARSTDVPCELRYRRHPAPSSAEPLGNDLSTR